MCVGGTVFALDCISVSCLVPNADRPAASDALNNSLAFAGGYTKVSCTNGTSMIHFQLCLDTQVASAV